MKHGDLLGFGIASQGPLFLFDVSIASRDPTGIPQATRILARHLLPAAQARGISFALCAVGRGEVYKLVQDLPPLSTARPREPSRLLNPFLAIGRRLPLPLGLRALAVEILSRRTSEDAFWFHPDLGKPAADVLEENRPTLLLLPHAGDVLLPRRAIQKLLRRGVRLAAICHDLIPLLHPEDFLPHDRAAFTEALSFVLAHACLILCDSAATRNDLQSLLVRQHARFPKLAVVPPPVEVAAPRTDARPEIARMERVATILTVGTFVPRKRHGLILEAFQRLRAQALPVELVAIGQTAPQGRRILAAFRCDPGFGTEIRVIEDASNQDVADAYARAAVHIFASHAEGYGMPIAEAAQFGCPTVCTDLPVFREFAPSGTRFISSDDPDEWAAALRPYVEAGPPPLRSLVVDPNAQARAIADRLCTEVHSPGILA